MKKLIINADDFGLTEGCNKGIIKAINEGIVTSTTVMINMPYAIDGIELLKKMGLRSVGVHLTLTAGTPTLPVKLVPSLVDNENKFYKKKALLFPHMNLTEVEMELRNQIELFIKTGLQPSHLDSHHHIHMDDGVREIVEKLAVEFNLPLRIADYRIKETLNSKDIPTTDGFSMDFYDEGASFENLKEILLNFNDGVMEIMVHPAILDDRLKNISRYYIQRESELTILTDKKWSNWLKENNYELIGYDKLGMCVVN